MSQQGPSKGDAIENDANNAIPNLPAKQRPRSNSAILRLYEERRKSMEDIATDGLGLTSPRGKREPQDQVVAEDKADSPQTSPRKTL